ncbi:MAG: DUF1015 family protein, partial [Mycoplasma sp.]
MSTIKPFFGLCYNSKSAKFNNLSKIVCPPYDMISDTSKEKLRTNNEFNNLELPSSYDTAKRILDEWIQNQVLVFSQKNLYPHIKFLIKLNLPHITWKVLFVL